MAISGVLYAILTSIFLSTGFVFAKHFLQFSNDETLNVLWFWIAFVVTIAILLLRDRLKVVDLFRLHWRDGLIVGGANAVAAVFWFKAVESAGPTLTAFILRFSTIIIVFLGVLFLKEKLHLHDIIGTGIAIAGALVINAAMGSYFSYGTLIAFAACFAIAVHQVLAKVYVKNIDPVSLVCFRVFYTAIFVTIYAAATRTLQPFPAHQLPLLTVAVIINAVIGFILLYKALELLDVSKVAVIRTLDPFVVIIFALAAFHTIPSLSQLIGGTLVVIGVLVTIYGHTLRKMLKAAVPW